MSPHPSRLIRELRSLFGALRWLAIVVLVLSPLALSTKPRPERPAWKDTGQLNFSTDAGITIAQRTDGRPAGIRLSSLEGKVMFTDAGAPADFVWFVRWSTFAETLVIGGMLFGVVHLLWRLFQDIERGKVFTDATCRRVRQLGILMILTTVVANVFSIWQKYRIGIFVAENLEIRGLTTLDPGSLASHLTFDVDGLVSGLIILALAEVFRRGLALQKESELTV